MYLHFKYDLFIDFSHSLYCFAQISRFFALLPHTLSLSSSLPLAHSSFAKHLFIHFHSFTYIIIEDSSAVIINGTMENGIMEKWDSKSGARDSAIVCSHSNSTKYNRAENVYQRK